VLVQFQKLPQRLEGFNSWGCDDGERTYVISFDDKHPELRWRASWMARDGAKQFVGDGFPSKASARRALIAVRDGKEN
jgi:hypothetical protein